MKMCLRRLGLVVNDSPAAVPHLTPLHLSSLNHSEAAELIFSLSSGDSSDIAVAAKDQSGILSGGENLFRLTDVQRSSESTHEANGHETEAAENPGKQVSPTFDLVVHEDSWPKEVDTPSFQHDLYFENLRRFHKIEPDSGDWGRILLYGEVVTSTNTILEK